MYLALKRVPMQGRSTVEGRHGEETTRGGKLAHIRTRMGSRREYERGGVVKDLHVWTYASLR